MGIIVDIALLFWFPHDRNEKIGGIVANAFIAIGLIVEYVVIVRAIVATGEANRESDEKVAEANARAAAAELRTETLRLELAWRRISAQQAEKISEVLSRADLPKFGLRIFHVAGDPEAITFSQDIAEVFRRNGWQVLFISTTEAIPPGMMIPLYSPPELDACAIARAAFQNADIEFMGGYPENSGGMMAASGDDISGPAAVIYVGSRLPPKLGSPAARNKDNP